MIKKGSDNFYHPKDENEIADLVKHARANHLKVRVSGSGHSTPAAIYTGNFPQKNYAPSIPPNDPNINIMLDQMRKVIDIDTIKKQVTVQAGCHLGYDPYDPTISTPENGLFPQIDAQGLAFP